MPSEKDESYEDERLRKEQIEMADHSPSSGATDPEHAAQDQSEEVATGRHTYTGNATFTKERMEAGATSEAQEQAEHVPQYNSLNELNRRLYDDDEKNARSEQDKTDYVNDTQAWGNQIGLTDFEIKRAARLVLSSTSGWMNNHGSEAIILAALTLSANESTPDNTSTSKAIRPQSPFVEHEDMADSYASIRDGLGVEPEKVKRCRGHLNGFL